MNEAKEKALKLALAQIEKEFKAGGRIIKINDEENSKYVLKTNPENA